MCSVQENCLLFQYYSYFFLLLLLNLYWGPWSSCTWNLCRMINIKLYFFFYTQRASKVSSIHSQCSPHSIRWFSVLGKNSSGHMYVGLFLGIGFIPPISLSFSVPKPCILYQDCSVIELEGRDGDSSRFIFYYPGLFCYPEDFFPYEFISCCFKVLKSVMEFWWESHWICIFLLVR